MKDLYALFRHSLAGLRVLLALTLLLRRRLPARSSPASRAVAAPWQAHGSLVDRDGEHTTDPSDAVGSALLGQLTGDDPASSSPGRRPPATATTRSTPTAPTSVPRAPSWSRRSRSVGPRSPSARASTRPPYRPTR